MTALNFNLQEVKCFTFLICHIANQKALLISKIHVLNKCNHMYSLTYSLLEMKGGGRIPSVDTLVPNLGPGLHNRVVVMLHCVDLGHG